MPYYDMLDKNTDEVSVVTLKIAELDQYLIDNPNMQRYHSAAPGLSDPIILGLQQPDYAFRERVSQIHAKAGARQPKDHKWNYPNIKNYK